MAAALTFVCRLKSTPSPKPTHNTLGTSPEHRGVRRRPRPDVELAHPATNLVELALFFVDRAAAHRGMSGHFI